MSETKHGHLPRSFSNSKLPYVTALTFLNIVELYAQVGGRKRIPCELQAQCTSPELIKILNLQPILVVKA
jgi:hypothetical protein